MRQGWIYLFEKKEVKAFQVKSKAFGKREYEKIGRRNEIQGNLWQKKHGRGKNIGVSRGTPLVSKQITKVAFYASMVRSMSMLKDIVGTRRNKLTMQKKGR